MYIINVKAQWRLAPSAKMCTQFKILYYFWATLYKKVWRRLWNNSWRMFYSVFFQSSAPERGVRIRAAIHLLNAIQNCLDAYWILIIIHNWPIISAALNGKSDQPEVFLIIFYSITKWFESIIINICS